MTVNVPHPSKHKLKSFVYPSSKIIQDNSSGQREIEVKAVPRKNGRARCGSCRKPGATYDTRKPRRFQFVPILGLQVFLIYAMRRVDCPDCGAKTEHLDWAHGKEQMTTAYKWFLGTWLGE